MTINIVQAEKLDMPFLPDLIRQLYPELQKDVIAKRLPRMEKMIGQKILLAKTEEGKIIGYMGYHLLTNLIYSDYFWVQDLVVDKEYRSKGIGKFLLDHLKELASAQDVSHVVLAANKAHLAAQRFYEEKMEMDKRGYIYRTKNSLNVREQSLAEKKRHDLVTQGVSANTTTQTV